MEDERGSIFSSGEFRKRLARGLFSAIRCKSCKKFVVPPTSVCNNCLSNDLEWVEISRIGRLVTFSEVHVPTTEFQDRAPYIVAIIETEGEGIRLPGTLYGANLNELRIGSRVKVSLEDNNTKKKNGGYFFSLIS